MILERQNLSCPHAHAHAHARARARAHTHRCRLNGKTAGRSGKSRRKNLRVGLQSNRARNRSRKNKSSLLLFRAICCQGGWEGARAARGGRGGGGDGAVSAAGNSGWKKLFMAIVAGGGTAEVELNVAYRCCHGPYRCRHVSRYVLYRSHTAVVSSAAGRGLKEACAGSMCSCKLVKGGKVSDCVS